MPSAEIEINDVWATTAPTGTHQHHTLPSGQTVEARKVSLPDLISAGVMTEADSLTAFIQKTHLGVRNTEDAMMAAMGDPKAFGSLVMLIDRIVPVIVVKPQIRLHFVDVPSDKPGVKASTKSIPPADREPGVIYTDQVPLHDKIFLTNWAVGDLSNLQQFRVESPAAVATVENVTDVPNDAQRTGRRGKGRKR